MGGEHVETTGKTWQEIGLNWLINQGAVTVLLFGILSSGGYMAYVMIPKHLETIQSGYEKIEDRNSMAIEKLAAAHEKSVDRIITLLEKKSVEK